MYLIFFFPSMVYLPLKIESCVCSKFDIARGDEQRLIRDLTVEFLTHSCLFPHRLKMAQGHNQQMSSCVQELKQLLKDLKH